MSSLRSGAANLFAHDFKGEIIGCSCRSCGDLEENAPWRSQSMDHCHYFLVLETDQGTSLVAEKLADGSATLVEPALGTLES